MYMYLSRTSSYRFIDSEESTMNDAYYEALAKVEILGHKEGIDEVFEREKLDALLLPSAGFTSGAPAIAGYPIITGTSSLLLSKPIRSIHN